MAVVDKGAMTSARVTDCQPVSGCTNVLKGFNICKYNVVARYVCKWNYLV